MSKKSFPFILLVILGMTALLSSCVEEPRPSAIHPTSIDAPRDLGFDPATLSFTWDAVPYATGYQCAIGTIFDLTLNAMAVNSNHATVVNPVKDKWETFYLRSVYSSGVYQITSDPVQIDFIVTDKTVLETPKDFIYTITDRVDNSMTIKIGWKAVSNAGSYQVFTSDISPSGVTGGSRNDALLVNEIVMTKVKIGHTITIVVIAQPGANSLDYVSSRKGFAHIKNIQ